MTYEKRLRYLLRAFADNKASEEEIREMLTLFRLEEGDRELESFMMELRQEAESYTSHMPVDWENMWNSINPSVTQPKTRLIKMKWMRVAAAAVIIFSISAYFFNRDTKNEIVKSEPVQQAKTEVQSTGNKAILTLADGSQIVLDNAANGKLAEQGTSLIEKKDGQIVYSLLPTANSQLTTAYNTMATPRGGQYSLILPDGSRVWLNAVSSIRYPTAFTAKERTVEITGEAYFEIAKIASSPFRVIVNPAQGNEGMQVEVLGTHFNINAYTDEPTINTTLLEGSVKVSRGARYKIIKPGEQTQLNNIGELKVVPDADVSEAVAWKDGRFEFRDADLKTILRQVMRWYDVDVEYKGDIPDRYFTAAISRNKTLSGVLNILKMSDVGFRLEGRKLTVTP